MSGPSNPKEYTQSYTIDFLLLYSKCSPLQNEKVPFLNVAARSADADSRGVNSQRFEAPVVSLRPATTKFQRAIIPRSGNRYPFSSNERVKQIAPDREIALLREAAVNYSAFGRSCRRRQIRNEARAKGI